MMKRILILITMMFVLPNLAWAETYYVGQEPSGRADGSDYENRMNVAGHNSKQFQPGDTIFLCDVITSKIILPSSGLDGRYIIYRGDYNAHPSKLQGPGPVLEINSKNYIELAHITVQANGGFAILATSANHFKIHDCVITNTSSYGITVQGQEYSPYQPSSNISIYKNDISGSTSAAMDGIWLRNGVTDFFVYKNIVKDWGHTAIHVSHSLPYWISKKGHIYENDVSAPQRGYGRALAVKGYPGGYPREVRIYRNFFHDLRARIQIAAEDIEFFNNIIANIKNCCEDTQGDCPEAYWNCINKRNEQTGQGILITSYTGGEANNAKVYNNVFFRTQETGLRVHTGNGHKIYNNIFLDCAFNPTSQSTYVDHSLYINNNPENLEIRNNIIYSPKRATDVFYKGAACSVAEFNKADKGSDVIGGNLGVYPSLSDPANNKFWPDDASDPPVNAGLNLEATYQDALDKISSWTGNVRTLSQNDYGSWEIGAFVYKGDSEPPLKGDLNADQQVDGLDIQLCVNVFLGLETNPDYVARAQAVVDPPDECNDLDVQEIVNIYLGE